MLWRNKSSGQGFHPDERDCSVSTVRHVSMAEERPRGSGFHPDERDCSVSTWEWDCDITYTPGDLVSIPTSGIVLFLPTPTLWCQNDPANLQRFHPDERDCSVSTDGERSLLGNRRPQG